MYRSLKYALLSLIPNVFPLFVVVAIMAIFDIRLNVGTVMVASLALGIAVDDTIHFLNHYLGAKSAGEPTPLAIENTLKVIGYPAFSTTVVLILSFLTFLLANFSPNLYFGVLLSIGIFVAFIADCLLLPAVLLRFDDKAKVPAVAEEKQVGSEALTA
jgi:predicted RND superfamily exporter protein